MNLILDTGVLGQIVHPRKCPEAKQWLRETVVEHQILISEIADYELRRELIRIRANRSLKRLDELGREFWYVPVTTSHWRTAARLWATLRSVGRPSANAENLDGDVLIAAQARAESAAVVTMNSRHFDLTVETYLFDAKPTSR